MQALGEALLSDALLAPAREIRRVTIHHPFRKSDRAVYIYKFEKKNITNIKPNELEACRELAQVIRTCDAWVHKY